MIGPCMCGDPYCAKCGDPIRAKYEAAEEAAMEAFQKAKLTPDEYEMVVKIGLVAVGAAREYAKARVEEAKRQEAEYREIEKDAKDLEP